MNQERRCVIIAGSPEIKWVEPGGNDFIIACDRGIEHAKRAGIVPSLLVGDFDSYRGQLPEGIPVITAPREKDDTDTMMAIRYALEQGYRDFVLLGALGGRFDHSIGNLTAAAYVAEQCGQCRLYGIRETVYFLKNGTITIPGEKGMILSAFSWSEQARGINYSGLKYPLQEAVLYNTFARGISNEFLEQEAVISVREGMLLIIVTGE